jgi:hypothetical protein
LEIQIQQFGNPKTTVFQHFKSHFQSKSFVSPSSENLQFQTTESNGAILLIFPFFLEGILKVEGFWFLEGILEGF